MGGIIARNIHKVYTSVGVTPVEALCGVSFSLPEKKCIAIMGPSGSGKSSLLNILAGLMPPTQGNYILNDVDVYAQKDATIAHIRNETIGFVAQNFALLEDRNVLENVITPMLFSNAISWKAMWKRGEELLMDVGLSDYARRPVTKLSGGQRQRVAIARALTLHPSLLLCDEPTAQLDSDTAEKIIELLLYARDHRSTVIIATHDMRVAQHCDNIMQLRDGRIIE